MNFVNYFFSNINKKLIYGIKPASGRNFMGRICVHHRCGGNKNKYFYIDFFRRINSFGFIYKIINNNNRTGNVGGIIYENGLFSYIILSEDLYIGYKLYSGSNNMKLKKGYTLLLKNIKLFSVVNNIEIYPNQGSSIIRSAGTHCILIAIKNNKVILKLKSGWYVHLLNNCLANIGCVSNTKHKFNCLKKAGKSRSLGKRPKVRGVAMNPCDHPHGGGEGKKSPPSGQRSPWGWLTKGTSSLKKQYKKQYKKIHKYL